MSPYPRFIKVVAFRSSDKFPVLGIRIGSVRSNDA